MFRDALAQRRCLVPADVFYEWQATENGKQPYASPARTASPWCSPGCRRAGAAQGHGAAHLHDRHHQRQSRAAPVARTDPVILESGDWPAWLGETEGESAALLRPSAAELRVWRVGKAVNNVRNDNASLLEPD